MATHPVGSHRAARGGHHKHHHHFRRGGVNGRDKRRQEEEEEFLVFGYSSKLHHQHGEPQQQQSAAGGGDEQQQQPFDEMRFLIPWNGDERLKIDRYDVRLYLNSLDEFDERAAAERRKRRLRLVDVEDDEDDDDEDEEEDNDEVEEVQLQQQEDAAEKLEEELCEEERYADMYEHMRKRENEEVAQKRGRGAEIGFTYEDSSMEKGIVKVEDEEEEDDEPYVKPESLKLPVGIVMPETMRENALIERTAKFVVEQGPQMEVVIKAKQRQNAEQFGFLDFDHRLHPYYKYICKLIREKKYTPQPPRPKKRKKIVESTPPTSESDSETEGYLHPLLMGGGASARTESPLLGPDFIGPSPRPAPTKAGKKPASPAGPDLDALVQQFHRSANNENGGGLYSKLLKGLHSIIPGGTSKAEEEAQQQSSKGSTEESGPGTVVTEASSASAAVGCDQSAAQDGTMMGGILYETDLHLINDYNKWHFDFYGRPSPYLPGPPPIALRPVPDSAVESSITVAAKYVALHSAVAEQRLIEHNQNKVHFLLPRSPYYTFYQQRVRQLQWQIYQQSITIPSPPPNPDLVPTQMPLDHPGREGESSATEAAGESTLEADTKQLERREKARLFMEKILNERMAEKSRKGKAAVKTLKQTEQRVVDIQPPSLLAPSALDLVEPQPSTTTTVSPLQLSKAISSLIDEQIKRTLGGTPSPKSPMAAEERKAKKKKDRKRKDDSSSSEDGEEGGEDKEEERSRKKMRRRRKSGSRSGSGERRRRERKSGRYHRSSSRHRRRHRSRSRSPRR